MNSDANKIRTYPLSDNCPEWLFQYVMNSALFDEFISIISPDIESWARLGARQRVKYVTDLCKAKGIKDIRYDRGRLCILLERTPDLVMAALRQ
jgi:hypothetical protein